MPALETVLDRLVAPLYLRAVLGHRSVDDDLHTLVTDTLRLHDPALSTRAER